MQLEIANRQKVKIKMALQGPSGSGKTAGGLLLGFGLCGDWTKIAVIDTENKSSHLFAHYGSFEVIDFKPPFTPERYIEAIKACERASMEVIIIDSISHEWNGVGGILEDHGKLTGNSYTNWSKLTPRHNAFIQYLLQSQIHVIGTIRSKQDYVLNEKNGKLVPEKIGLKGISREGLDYEFTLAFNIDMKQQASASKDRTGLFYNKPEFILSVETGKQIKAWCNQSTIPLRIPTNEELMIRINECKSLKELLSLYDLYPDKQQPLSPEFTKRKQELILQNNDTNKIAQQQNLITNGTTVNQ